MRDIFHIDANSAYLSWTAVDLLEQGCDMDIRTIPAVIAGDPASRHGIILTKSIPAKAYHIQTGESLFAARKKCPALMVFKPDYDLYIACSDAMYEILTCYSDTIERYSVDECWLDFTASKGLLGDPLRTAYEIRDRIKRELGFTVNVGVSSNKLLAKMGSELRKPDLVHTLYPEEIPQKLWPLPAPELFYVGRATTRKLNRLGIDTIGKIAACDLNVLQTALKPVHGRLVWEYANGIDREPVRPNDSVVQKGVGNSTTTAFDVTEREDALMFILALTERVARRLRKLFSFARTVHISIRREDLTFVGHQHRLDRWIGTTDEIFYEAVRLFDQLWEGEPLRHLGVHVGELARADHLQTSVFDRSDVARLRTLDETVDRIRTRYGEKSIVRGIFTNQEIRPVQGGVNDGNYLLMGGHAQ